MAIFDPELLKRFEHVCLVARHAGGASLVAGPRTPLSGGGTGRCLEHVTGLRDYAPGDDYRHIDWALCARRDELLTRTFASDEDLHVYILLDCSPSMGLGRPSKFQLARQIAAVLGYAAASNLDRLSLTAFSDRVVAEGPPIRHKARFPRLLRFLRELSVVEQPGTRTSLARTAEGFVRRYQRRGPVVVIGDLYDRRGFQGGLDILRSRGYEPRVVQIYEPREAEPALLGEMELYDVEAETALSATITERAVRQYQVLFARFCASVRGYCARHGLACLQVASDTPENEVLLRALGARRSGHRGEMAKSE